MNSLFRCLGELADVAPIATPRDSDRCPLAMAIDRGPVGYLNVSDCLAQHYGLQDCEEVGTGIIYGFDDDGMYDDDDPITQSAAFRNGVRFGRALRRIRSMGRHKGGYPPGPCLNEYAR